MSKTKKTKYSVRIDRIAILVIILIGIPCLISSLFKACSKNDITPEDDTVISQQDEKVSNSFSSFEGAIDRLGFEKRSYSVNDIHYGELILVNNEHEYIFNENKQVNNVEISASKNDFYNVVNTSMKLQSSAIEQLNNLMKDYYTQYSDASLTISSAYRTKAEQDILYSQATYNGVAENPAGFSENHTGYAFNFSVMPQDSSIQPFESYVNSSWIIENCAKYGFIQCYPEDKKSITGISNPSHFRYVSLPHSMYMKENNLCL